MSRPIALAALLALCAPPALAEDCRTDGGPLPDLAKGTVTAPKAPFVKGSCHADPSAPGCALTAYLVAGDTVFLGPEQGLLRCVGYLGPGGGYTEGWIASAVIEAW